MRRPVARLVAEELEHVSHESPRTITCCSPTVAIELSALRSICTDVVGPVATAGTRCGRSRSRAPRRERRRAPRGRSSPPVRRRRLPFDVARERRRRLLRREQHLRETAAADAAEERRRCQVGAVELAAAALAASLRASRSSRRSRWPWLHRPKLLAPKPPALPLALPPTCLAPWCLPPPSPSGDCRGACRRGGDCRGSCCRRSAVRPDAEGRAQFESSSGRGRRAFGVVGHVDDSRRISAQAFGRGDGRGADEKLRRAPIDEHSGDRDRRARRTKCCPGPRMGASVRHRRCCSPPPFLAASSSTPTPRAAALGVVDGVDRQALLCRARRRKQSERRAGAQFPARRGRNHRRHKVGRRGAPERRRGAQNRRRRPRAAARDARGRGGALEEVAALLFDDASSLRCYVMAARLAARPRALRVRRTPTGAPRRGAALLKQLDAAEAEEEALRRCARESTRARPTARRRSISRRRMRRRAADFRRWNGWAAAATTSAATGAATTTTTPTRRRSRRRRSSSRRSGGRRRARARVRCSCRSACGTSTRTCS